MAFPTEYAKGTPQGVFLFVMLFFSGFFALFYQRNMFEKSLKILFR